MTGRALVETLPITGPHVEMLRAARDALCAAALEQGVTVALSTDWNDLLDLNRRHVDTWLPLMHQPAGDDAFWLAAVDADGEVVATQGGVLMDCSERSFGDRLSDLSFFYDRPEDAAPGERCFCASDAAHETRGRVCYLTAGWTHPSMRGRGLFHRVGRLVRLIAWDRWNPHSWAGMVAPDIAPLWSEEKAGRRFFEHRPTIWYLNPASGFDYPPYRFIRFTRPGVYLDMEAIARRRSAGGGTAHACTQLSTARVPSADLQPKRLCV
ncbi:MAG TPA: hypothetical protein VD995_04700 [Azospirillum sp.]|nr:hypothetical protein [Azospirillum sp.]